MQASGQITIGRMWGPSGLGRRLRAGRLLSGRLDVGLGSHSKIRLQFSVALWEELVSLLIANGGQDHNVIASLPVRGCRDLLVISELQRVDNSQHLVEVAPCRGRISMYYT